MEDPLSSPAPLVGGRPSWAHSGPSQGRREQRGASSQVGALGVGLFWGMGLGEQVCADHNGQLVGTWENVQWQGVLRLRLLN